MQISLKTFVLSVVILFSSVAADASGFKTLYAFANSGDGAYPTAPVVHDRSGNLYGTTYGGTNGTPNGSGGTVFRLTPDGALSVLHTFRGKHDGAGSQQLLVTDGAGHFYGTTTAGGKPDCNCGVVFRVTSTGDFSVVYRLHGGNKGASAAGPILIGNNGNLYGTASEGGRESTGLVFELHPAGGDEKVLHRFGSPGDGELPLSALAMDSGGNLYGTTFLGGPAQNGTIFRITADGSYKILHAFKDGADGINPFGVVLDSAGNLYGTAFGGGKFRPECSLSGQPRSQGACGIVFKLATGGAETVLHDFGHTPTDGLIANDSLVVDAAGNVYGTTEYGGRLDCNSTKTVNCGTVFKIDASGNETILHAFSGPDGGLPDGGLSLYKNHLYGTTEFGGPHNAGTVFRVDLPQQ